MVIILDRKNLPGETGVETRHALSLPIATIVSSSDLSVKERERKFCIMGGVFNNEISIWYI